MITVYTNETLYTPKLCGQKAVLLVTKRIDVHNEILGYHCGEI
jgi:hypothetical protein